MIDSKALPHQYPRRILLAVTGISPQILTETLYKLAVDSHPAFIPTEIHLIGTAHGIDIARQQLLSNGAGQYHRLLKDYGLSGRDIAFDEGTCHQIVDQSGQLLNDIRDAAANQQAADFILDIVRSFCSDPCAAIHASMSGGRKTLGFYLGYAMSLLGRTQDRLSHILVNEPFESCPDFYFPPARPVDLLVGDARINSSAAKLTLADVPFVRLSSKLALERLQEGMGYIETVKNIQSGLDKPTLIIDFDQGRACAHGQWLDLSPKPFAILAWLAIRAKIDQAKIAILGQEARNAEELVKILAETNVSARSINALESSGMYTREDFGPDRTRLNDFLREQLGPCSEHYSVATSGNRPFSSYLLRLLPDQIEIRGFGSDELIQFISSKKSY